MLLAANIKLFMFIPIFFIFDKDIYLAVILEQSLIVASTQAQSIALTVSTCSFVAR